MTSQDLWLELLDYGPGKRRIPRLIDMTVCDRSTCTKPATLLCSACRGRRYCSVECQKQHWRDEGHKKQCVPPTLMHCVMREDMVGCRALLAKTKDQEHKSVAAAPPPKAQEQVALTIEDGASKKKRPIIHYVMATNNRALLNLFVEHGADLQQQDTEGQTALQILKAHETTRAVKLQNPLASG